MDPVELRAAFPVFERLAFLNAGSDGPVPAAAARASADEVRAEAEQGRTYDFFKRRGELGSRLRAAYAALLGCDSADVALTTSTSEGASTVVAGLDLGPGDEIVTAENEHPGLLGPLQAARDLRGVTVREVPLAEVADAVGERTKLVACSHVAWMSGKRAPAALASLDAPVLLDGAQGIGAVPTDVAALGCAFYAGSGQKWLCGPDGSGMLYVAPEWRERLAVTRRSYLSYKEAMKGLDAELAPDARRFDAPSIPGESHAFALASLDLLGSFGWDAVYARAGELAAGLAQRLREAGREVLERDDTTLVSWRTDDDEGELARVRQADVAIRNLPGHGLLRASVGAWNDESDLDRLLAALA